MRLLGAKEFLKTVKPGTLCVEFWEDDEEDCLEIIKEYKNGENIIEKHYGEFYIFGDNGGSLTFLKKDNSEEIEIGNKKYDCLFYYDKNIVGDASPSTTLQLVFENEDEYPDEIFVENSSEILNKEDIINIKNWFIKNVPHYPISDWVWESLNDNYYKDNIIVNFK